MAVDATTRNLLWGYQYPRTQQVNTHLNPIRINMFPIVRRVGDRWADSTITVADGKVIVTPIESDYLYVLNLINGEVQWKIERGGNLYVACVHGGNVIVVGRNQVNAYPLAGGEPVWTCWTSRPELMPDGGMPSGRGFQSGHDYYLPLASGEVVQIDLTRGQIASRARSRSGEVARQFDLSPRRSDFAGFQFHRGLRSDRSAPAGSRPKARPEPRRSPARSPGWEKSDSTKASCKRRSICSAAPSI